MRCQLMRNRRNKILLAVLMTSLLVSMSCWSNRPATMHTWRKANPNPKVKLSLTIMETPWRYLI
nr:MAG TPA: hypothetical protein [Inoviridae sp.]